MKNNFRFFITFCLMLFITVFKCSNVYAVSNPFNGVDLAKTYTDSAISTASKWSEINSYSNVLVVYTVDGTYSTNPTNASTTYYALYICSNNPITANFSVNGYGQTILTANAVKNFAVTANFLDSKGELGTSSVNVFDFYGTTVVSYVPYATYTYKGSVTVGGSVAPPVSSLDPVTDITASDILNFNWEGSGIKIYNYSEGDKISGYLDDDNPDITRNMKCFDTEIYGKFIMPSWTAYSTRYTAMYNIENSFNAYFNGKNFDKDNMYFKDFEWLSDDFSAGAEVKFRVVIKMWIADKGVTDLKFGTTICDDGDWTYYSDSISNVEFLNDNDVYGTDIDTSGSSGNVGDEPGNKTGDSSYTGTGNGSLNDGLPNSPSSDGSITDWFTYFKDLVVYIIVSPFRLIKDVITTCTGYITEMLDILTPFSKKINELFVFIPSDILKVCWGVISFTLMYSVIRGVLKMIRG